MTFGAAVAEAVCRARVAAVKEGPRRRRGCLDGEHGHGRHHAATGVTRFSTADDLW